MILYFIADLLLNYILGLPSYFTIGSLSKINKNNYIFYLLIAIFYDTYLFMHLFYYLVIFAIVGIINFKLFSKKPIIKSLIGYSIFFAYNILFISFKSLGTFFYLIVIWSLLFNGLEHIIDRINIYIKR